MTQTRTAAAARMTAWSARETLKTDAGLIYIAIADDDEIDATEETAARERIADTIAAVRIINSALRACKAS